MDSNSVSPMPELAPIAEFDKSPPTPPNDDVPMDDLPPPPTTVVALPDDTKKIHRAASYEEESEPWGCGNWFEYAVVVSLATVLLLGAPAVTIFWVMYYREGFAWNENPQLQFNLHPVLMVGGFITFSGFSVLLYRLCRCCRRIYVKLFHTIFHALAVPCVVVGFLAVLDSHNLATPPIPNFYSLHSWLGLTTMGLFAIQFIVGFFSFLLLLCCDSATASFRASLVPVHASFGLITFMLAVATCLTGLTERAIFTLGSNYSRMPEEGIVINAIGASIIGLAILVSYILTRTTLKVKHGNSQVMIRASADLDTYSNWVDEGIVINALGAILIALGILISFAVRRSGGPRAAKVYTDVNAS